jgi:hypothetical protein
MPFMSKEDTINEFDQEELTWPEVNPDIDKYALLQMNGMFRFRYIKDILNLKSIMLTRLKDECNKKEIDMYKTYGVKKVAGSQYIVRMSLFSRCYIERFSGEITGKEEVKVQQLPEHVSNINALFQCEGVYKFADFKHFPPISQFAESITKKIKNIKAMQGNRCGIWFDPFSREYLVNMSVFKKWFVEQVWNNDEQQ